MSIKAVRWLGWISIAGKILCIIYGKCPILHCTWSPSKFLINVCFLIGHFSWRSSRQGSYFIRALSDELVKSLSSTDGVDLAQVLTNVTRAVAYDFQSAAATPELNAKKQVPSLYSTLTKEIHFPNSASTGSFHPVEPAAEQWWLSGGLD